MRRDGVHTYLDPNLILRWGRGRPTVPDRDCTEKQFGRRTGVILAGGAHDTIQIDWTSRCKVGGLPSSTFTSAAPRVTTISGNEKAYYFEYCHHITLSAE